MNCDFLFPLKNLKNLLHLHLSQCRCSPTWRQVPAPQVLTGLEGPAQVSLLSILGLDHTLCTLYTLCYKWNLIALVWQILTAQWLAHWLLLAHCRRAEILWERERNEEGEQRLNTVSPRFSSLHWGVCDSTPATSINPQCPPPHMHCCTSSSVVILELRLQRMLVLLEFFQQTYLIVAAPWQMVSHSECFIESQEHLILPQYFLFFFFSFPFI